MIITIVDPFILNKLSELHTLCIKYQIKKLYIFGSAVDGRFSGSSDIDFLVELPRMKNKQAARLLTLFWFELQALYEREVDLITPDCVRDRSMKIYLSLYKTLLYSNYSLESSLRDYLH